MDKRTNPWSSESETACADVFARIVTKLNRPIPARVARIPEAPDSRPATLPERRVTATETLVATRYQTCSATCSALNPRSSARRSLPERTRSRSAYSGFASWRRDAFGRRKALRYA